MILKPIEASSYEVLIDRNRRSETILGLKVNPMFGESFVIPMTIDTATEIGAQLLAGAQR